MKFRVAAALLLWFALAAPAGDTVVRLLMWKPDAPPVWQEAFRRAEARLARVRIVVDLAPHSATDFHALLTQKLKNRDPSLDLFVMDVIWPSEFAAAGWVLPIDARFPPEERAKFLPGVIAANTYRGRIYGIPSFVDAGLLYYRQDLLEKHGFAPPTTWPELVRQATIITGREGPGLYGYSGQFKQYEGLVCDMLELVASNGGRLISEDGRRATLSDPRTLEAVRFARDRILGRLTPPGVLAYEELESLAVFADGRAVFHRNWPYAWRSLGDPARSRVVGKVGAAPLPAFPGGRSVSALGGWQFALPAFSRKTEAAWAVARFLTGPEMQRFFAVRESRAPTRTALYDDPEVLRANPEFRHQRQAFWNARPRPRTPVYALVSNRLQAFFSRAIADPRSDLEGLARAYDRLIDLDLALVEGGAPEGAS
jgi:multiple sugar transport system substrate-binding protein